MVSKDRDAMKGFNQFLAKNTDAVAAKAAKLRAILELDKELQSHHMFDFTP